MAITATLTIQEKAIAAASYGGYTRDTLQVRIEQMQTALERNFNHNLERALTMAKWVLSEKA